MIGETPADAGTDGDRDAVLEDLKSRVANVPNSEPVDDTRAVLDQLRSAVASTPENETPVDDTDTVLDALREQVQGDDASEHDTDLADLFSDDETSIEVPVIEDVEAEAQEQVQEDEDTHDTEDFMPDEPDTAMSGDEENEVDIDLDDLGSEEEDEDPQDQDMYAPEVDLDDLSSYADEASDEALQSDDNLGLDDLMADEPIGANGEDTRDDEPDDVSENMDGDLTEDEGTPEPESEPFGILTTERPADVADAHRRFRIAILGDFSGRASRGELEIGAGLAKRKPIKFDIDNLDGVIARFSTTLVLPIGQDGAGIEVKLSGLDDLHPDELYENVEVFAELSALRQRVKMGDGANAIAEMQGWAGEFGDLSLTSRKRAKGSAVPADRKLNEFDALIQDMQERMAESSTADALIQRIVAPFVQAAPDPAQETMLAVVDEALSAAMRAILHHPDFQAVEATWRSLEMLARRVETGPNVEIVLYDVSAEEWAADLAAQDDLGQSGLFQMLAEEPRLDDAQGPLSAVFGLYTLEETPPHAELMGRMSKISAWMNAPFMAAISPKFLDTKKEDRHPLVRKTWDALRALPEAVHVGLVAPRFLLRLPYGQKTEPVDPFTFEEFTLRDGLRGMLWGNPVVVSAVLMAKTATDMGKKMRLGEIMSTGDMPFHYMTDQFGDQVALPCTERLLNTRTMAEVVSRGFMPLLSIKGRNEVRQGSFQALGAGELAGPWGATSDASTGKGSVDIEMTAGAAPESSDEADPADDDNDLDAMFADSDDDGDDGDTDLDALFADDGDDDSDDDGGDLDALLAGFDDDTDGSDDDDDGDMDADLAAMLEDL
ncbi:MAG: type VI secretion system contractile sheath large subunit [Paracoccaceae bacterium]